MTDTITDAGYAYSAQRFAADTACHQLTILHQQGVYRHLRFADPGHQFYWFDLHTSPGLLTVRGDVDAFVFLTGLGGDRDPLGFFRDKPDINPDYWRQRVMDGPDRIRAYHPDRFREAVLAYTDTVADELPGLRAAVEQNLLGGEDRDLDYECNARDAVADFYYPPTRTYPLRDARLGDLTDWSWEYLWCCHAILLGVRLYDQAMAEWDAG